MAKAYLVSTINPDTGMSLYLGLNNSWVESKQQASIFTRAEADKAIALLDLRNRQMDPEDRLHPTLEGILS